MRRGARLSGPWRQGRSTFDFVIKLIEVIMKSKVTHFSTRNALLDYCPSSQQNSSSVIIIDITGV